MESCRIIQKDGVFSVVYEGETQPIFSSKDPKVANSCVKAINCEDRAFTVWVGGTEVVDYFVPFSNALRIAEAWRQDGYDDVSISFLAEKDQKQPSS